MKEIKCIDEAFDFYRYRITQYNEEELDKEHDTFFDKVAAGLQNRTVLEDAAPQLMPPRTKKARESKG